MFGDDDDDDDVYMIFWIVVYLLISLEDAMSAATEQLFPIFSVSPHSHCQNNKL